MPVGGSVSASSLNKAAGARTRTSLVVAGVVMAVLLVAFGDAIGNIAMPALAALLILVGYRTIKPSDLGSVWRTGTGQRIVLVTTFALTMAIPLQYAVVAGVALSVALYVIGQSNHVSVKRRIFTEDGHVVEIDPPARLPANDVVVLQPYGSLFFAAAPIFEAALPEVTPSSRNTVVILRLRERSDVGSTFIDVLRRYAASLATVGSKLVIVSLNEPLAEQFRVTGFTEFIGPENLYRATEQVGAALEQAHRDARAWIATQTRTMTPPSDLDNDCAHPTARRSLGVRVNGVQLIAIAHLPRAARRRAAPVRHSASKVHTSHRVHSRVSEGILHQ